VYQSRRPIEGAPPAEPRGPARGAP